MINLVKNILSVFAKHGLFDEGVTLIGSWCFQLYQKHFYVAKFPLQTQDIDFLKAALSSTGMPVGEWQIALVLRASTLDVLCRGLLNQFIKCHGHARGYLLRKNF